MRELEPESLELLTKPRITDCSSSSLDFRLPCNFRRSDVRLQTFSERSF